MTKLIKRTIVCVVLFVTTLSAKADYDFKVNNINYNIISLEERTCEVCNPNSEYSESTSPYYTGDFVIPSIVNYNGTSFTVVGIGANAFINSDITSIIIPNTVIEIGQRAFRSCEKLKSVKFSSQLLYILKEAFSGCKSLKSLKLPSTLESIGPGAFWGCSSLSGTFVSPISCRGIGSEAFDFTKIKNVIIPNRGKMKAFSLGEICFPSADSIYIGANMGYYIGSSDDMYFKREKEHYSLYDISKVTFGDSVVYMPGMGERQNQYVGVERLTIGYNIQRIPNMPNHIMGEIYMRNPNPPFAIGFTDRTYANAILYVPKGSKSAYKSALIWKKFVNIQEYNVNLPSSVQEFHKKVIIDGQECVEINGLFWRTKNVGASSLYDVGSYIQYYALYDSIRTWESQGWRLPTIKETEKVFRSEYGVYYQYDFFEKIKLYHEADIYEALVVLPAIDDIETDYFFADRRNSSIIGHHVRLVMDKSRIQKQQEEQRLKARYDNINKLVEKNGATYTLRDIEMQYEFALENSQPHDNTVGHALVLRYTKNGSLYMSIKNGDANEFNTIFSCTGLEGTSKQWSEGYYKIAPTSSNTEIAREISWILKCMNTAQKKFIQQKKEEAEALAKQREEEQKKNRLVISHLISHPIGIESTNWTDAYSSQKKAIFNKFPQMKSISKGNCIIGTLDKEIALYGSYVRYILINYMKDKIYVRYTINEKNSQFREELFDNINEYYTSSPSVVKQENRSVEREPKSFKCKQLIGAPSKQRELTIEFLIE